jgi:S-formylglutathione hydrolase
MRTMPEALETLSEHACFGGVQGFYRHDVARPSACRCASACTGRRRRARARPVPVLVYLAGLTCNEETFAIKAGAQRVAAELGLMLVTPDTSPRGTGVEGADAAWDFGTGAGFYLDATQALGAHWRMESWCRSCRRCWRRISALRAARWGCSATRWAATAR